MVFYFTSNVVLPSHLIYMGLDKHENEELIKWGWPEDVWFHVDKLSSAHVYLRLNKGETIDSLPEAVLVDCAQLVKGNSIQGCKSNNIDVVYTPWENLKKTAGMDVGQVGFFKAKEVKTIHVEKKMNEILNRLNKTKEEKLNEDFRGLREKRDVEERTSLKAVQRDLREKEKAEKKRKQEEAELRSYSSLHKEENMTSNQDDGNDSDDFI
ncbi:coiled-coil domain-containing protein 25-like [Lineus longissimus]|uniref:coiled-coil domain-containing protein 25-like n=1 Tax=Lineus longissimus TaxID=88925 RepID=UPI002B4D40BF